MAQPTPQDITNLLPIAPDGYHYEVVVVSPMVSRVDLIHPYMPYQNKTPRTAYAFIKGNKVHSPKSIKMANPRSVCELSELYKQSPYSTVIPKTRSLLHIK